MLSVSHNRDIAPLHSEPVRQTQDGDGGAVGPTGIQLGAGGEKCKELGAEVSTFILRGAMY